MPIKQANKKRVMVFGVFDGLHDGHLHFLNQASLLGRVTAVATRNTAVLAMKGHKPKFSLAKRIAELKETKLVLDAVTGDAKAGSWLVIQKNKPDIIALGYDQKELKKSLGKFIRENKLKIKLQTISSHKPKKMHSSLLRKKATSAS